MLISFPIIFLLLLIISALSATVVAYYLLEKRKSVPGAFYYGMLMVTLIVWIIGDIIEYYSPGLNEKIIGLTIQYVFGIPYAPVFWLLAAINFVSLGKKPRRYERAVLFIIPVTTTVLMLTGEFQHLFYFNYHIYKYDSFLLLYKNWGVWFYFNVVYSYLALLCGTVILFYFFLKSKHFYRKQAILFLAGISLPWIASYVYVHGMNHTMKLDFTPIFFPFSIILIVWAIFKYHLFDIVPAAHDVVIESMDNGLVVLDTFDRIVDINRSAGKLFSNEDFLGKPVQYLLQKLNISDDILESDPSVFKFVNINSEVFNVSSSTIFTKHRKISGKLINFYNITELKKKENELSELNAAKDKFLSILAHDLKNPFFSILGFTDLLSDENEIPSEDEKKEMINSIRNISINTYSILENLLEWAYQQTGKMEFNPEVFDLNILIKENIRQIYKSAELKRIDISSVVPENCFVFADKNMIQTVLRNLISNAIKFTKPKGFIKISSKNISSQVYVSVKDSGVGIDNNDIKQIFQTGKTKISFGTSGEKGTGLGLALCSEFIQKNGGNISVESEIGKGSTFTFTIPANNS